MKTKSILFLLAMLMLCPVTFAQSADNEDEVIKIDEHNRYAFREGELIVHFREDSRIQMHAPQKTAFSTTADSEMDNLFQVLGVDSVEELMPRTGRRPLPRMIRSYSGKDIEPKQLGKLYRLKLAPDAPMNIHQAIDTLKTLNYVDFAEPNYIVYALSSGTSDSATYVSEPLYSQQWGIEAINLHKLWNKPKVTTKRPVIAILDTGVDIEHPDLAANIWTNDAEANGVSGQDDDANGFSDDIHGWDFINQTGVIRDFNGHGTHCAGIAAAVGNNGIGITGANPDAYIMPVTVMQSDGTGDIATIIRGIDYASANGADVISMSFGGNGYSIAEEQALGRAYANAVLVAAAGNDGCCINCNICGGPMFPAAFTFVLGVEASTSTTGNLASFSNFDDDGPIYSAFGEESLYNYELRAPGVNILSTFPNGRYKVLNGTSMACPLVAGALSRLLQCKTDSALESKEVLFGDLIHTRQNGMMGHIDIDAVYNITNADRKPTIWLVGKNLVDSLGDGDGRPDAGDTLEIYPIFRNDWGTAQNVRFWIKTGFDNGGDWMWDDTTLVTHLQDTVYFNKPLSSYAKATSPNPWRMAISPNAVDGRHINFTFFAVCDSMLSDTLRQNFVLEVENCVEIGGMIMEDRILYPNVHYIVTNNITVAAGVTLTINPGTILKFKNNVGVRIEKSPSIVYKDTTINGHDVYISYPNPDLCGHIVAKGTPDCPIIMISEETDPSRTTISNPSFYIVESHNLPDSVIDNIRFESDLSNYWEYVKFEGRFALYNMPLKNCIIYQSSIRNDAGVTSIYRCNGNNHGDFSSDVMGKFNNIVNSSNVMNGGFCFDRVTNGNVLLSKPVYLFRAPEAKVYSTPANYYGTSKENILRRYIKEIDNGNGFGHYDLSSVFKQPIRETHGIVWKILVNGYDAQDEFDSIPPLGVGTHRCDVYFNRPMDISKIPVISYGVRPPYTQHQVTENGSWSVDSTIYTAYFTIDAKTVSDGLNCFKVYGAEDLEHFEIPEENFRFNFEIAATGSMSTGLMATPGLGKVTLNWETDEEDFQDLLGYNIYRWTNDTIIIPGHYDENWNWIEESRRLDTICINQSLIDSQDTAYIDYDVVPGKAYYYIIRQMTTSLSSYDISNPVTARPLTAIKGDANGSMSVDVADIITEANYITLQNPQPFIFEAADVNSDNKVDVIDIVGTVNIILHPQANSNAITNSPAYYYVQNGILYVEMDVVLGGVQLSLNGDSDEAVTPLDALNGFEKIGLWQTDEDYLFLAYSMSGKTLGVGTHALLQIGDADITSLVLSDAQGHNVEAVPQASTALDGTKYMPNSRKYLEDGHLYIQIGNTVYSASGQLIK